MLKSVVLLAAFLFTCSAFSADRIVLLAPAAADIIKKLGCGEKVAGKTRSVDEFSDAVKVGSHIRPNLEIIMSLKPDLIITQSNRFFTEEMRAKAGVPVLEYSPVTLDGILGGIAEIGAALDRASEAEKLILELEKMLADVKKTDYIPSVLFEVMELPYAVAGQGNIVSDIIRAAGGENKAEGDEKMIKMSVEYAVGTDPDIYIYQEGPMNKKPVPPGERQAFSLIKPVVIKVDEKKYSRPNTVSFENVLELNRVFHDFGAERNEQ